MTEEAQNSVPSDLSEYLGKFSNNLSGPVPKCAELADELLSSCANRLNNNQHVTSAQLFQFGFGSWRSSVALNLAGASAQIPILLRHAVECGLYAFLCMHDKQFEDQWFERESNPKAKSEMRGRNGPLPKAKSLLENRNPLLKSRLVSTLDTLIDFGAHPNILQFVDHVHYEEDSEKETSTVFLLGSEEARNSGWVLVCGVSLDLAAIYREMWPIRFDAHLEARMAEVHGQANLFRNWHHAQ